MTKAQVLKLLKDAEKVKKLQEQMRNLHNELTEIKEKNLWSNYTGESFINDLDKWGVNNIKYFEAQRTVNYALRWN